MQAIGRDFYIRHDFVLYDSGIMAVLPLQLFHLYDLLVRYVWRAERSRTEDVQALRKEGYITTKITYRALASMLGFEKTRTVAEYMKILKALGWVRVRYSSEGHAPIYLLGESITDSAGGLHEVFYARAQLQAIVTHLDQLAVSQTGNTEAALNDLPFRIRIAAVRTYLNNRFNLGLKERRRPDSDAGTESDEMDPFDVDMEGGPGGGDPPLEGGGGAPPVGGGGGPPGGGVLLEVENAVRTECRKNPPADAGREGIEPRGQKQKEAPRGEIPEILPSKTSRAGGPEESSAPTPDFSEFVEKKRRELLARDKQVATAAMKQGAVVDNRREALTTGKRRSLVDRAALQALESFWRERLALAFPGVRFAVWGPRELKEVGDLLRRYGGDRSLIEGMMSYLVGDWDAFNKQVFKGKATGPSLSLLARFHETLATAAQQRGPAVSSDIEARVQKWYAENPGEPLPDDLVREYTGGA